MATYTFSDGRTATATFLRKESDIADLLRGVNAGCYGIPAVGKYAVYVGDGGYLILDADDPNLNDVPEFRKAQAERIRMEESYGQRILDSKTGDVKLGEFDIPDEDMGEQEYDDDFGDIGD